MAPLTKLPKYQFLALFLLGFSSGLPFCLIGSTLQAWFSTGSMSVMAVSMLGFVAQPYMAKFLWAPYMDRFSIGQWERRRGWIFLLQSGLIGLLLILSFLTPQQHPMIMAGLAWVIAFLSASQDTVIDAYRAEILVEKERGLGAAVAVSGYRGAVLLSGGLALVMAEYWGWQLTYQCMAAFMLIGVLGNYLAPLVPFSPQEKCTQQATLLISLKDLFRQNKAWPLMAFIFLYKLGEAFTSTTSSLTIPFLIQGLHFDLVTVGVVNKIGGVASMVVGSFIAGALMLRLSLFRALMLFGIGQTLSVLMFLSLAIIGKNFSLLLATVIVDNLIAGMSTTALLALMMGLCHHRFTASHFAFLSAVSALPRIIAGPIGGFFQSYIGWKMLYVGVFFATWPVLILLCYLFPSIKQLKGSE